MSAPPPFKLRDGDYVLIWADRPDLREDARKFMRAQGCRGIRFAELPPDRVQVHGYLAAMGEPL